MALHRMRVAASSSIPLMSTFAALARNSPLADVARRVAERRAVEAVIRGMPAPRAEIPEGTWTFPEAQPVT